MRQGCSLSVVLALLLAAVYVSVPLAVGGNGTATVCDANPPTGEILSPLPGSWSHGWVDLRVRFTDPDGILNYSLSASLDGAQIEPSWYESRYGSVLYAYLYGLAEGTHSVEARASDQLGNGPTILTWSFSVDTTAPKVEITSPRDNPELADGSVILTWTGNDTGSGIDYYELRLDNGPAFRVGNVTTFRFHSLEPGIHYFYVKAYDHAGLGNWLPEVAIATVPATPPAPPNPANTIVTVIVPNELPGWAVALLVIGLVEPVAILGLGSRWRRRSRDTLNE